MTLNFSFFCLHLLNTWDTGRVLLFMVLGSALICVSGNHRDDWATSLAQPLCSLVRKVGELKF